MYYEVSIRRASGGNARQRRVARRKLDREHQEWIKRAAVTPMEPWEHDRHLREYIAAKRAVRKLHS
jgi:hypothetical protein